MGAALSKVSGTVDYVISMAGNTRENAYAEAKTRAEKDAIKRGAEPCSLHVLDKLEVPLAYLPGNAMRYYLKVVGDLAETDHCSPGRGCLEEKFRWKEENPQ